MNYYETTGKKVSRQLSRQLYIAIIVLLLLIGLNAALPNAIVFILVNVIGVFLFGFITVSILKG